MSERFYGPGRVRARSAGNSRHRRMLGKSTPDTGKRPGVGVHRVVYQRVMQLRKDFRVRCISRILPWIRERLSKLATEINHLKDSIALRISQRRQLKRARALLAAVSKPDTRPVGSGMDRGTMTVEGNLVYSREVAERLERSAIVNNSAELAYLRSNRNVLPAHGTLMQQGQRFFERGRNERRDRNEFYEDITGLEYQGRQVVIAGAEFESIFMESMVSAIRRFNARRSYWNQEDVAGRCNGMKLLAARRFAGEAARSLGCDPETFVRKCILLDQELEYRKLVFTRRNEDRQRRGVVPKCQTHRKDEKHFDYVSSKVLCAVCHHDLFCTRPHLLRDVLSGRVATSHRESPICPSYLDRRKEAMHCSHNGF
jgi:hypothetical protein